MNPKDQAITSGSQNTRMDREILSWTGKVTAIGVFSYSVPYLEEIFAEATVVPAVVQIENHPSLPQQDIVDFCKEKVIHITAYSHLDSIGEPLLETEPVIEVANVAPTVVLLSYYIARGSSVLAKSFNPSRIQSNKKIIKLDVSDMKALKDHSDDLKKNGKLVTYVYPAFGVDLKFPDQSK
ncbi:NADP-dependent oxidoreductase domain-containing protein [Calycina marina]|uniref:NADP-dependent oxidoreductase domain-containing protein n=1 Tax=Calycina marina TaxID=1763456 RepID=A0A9P8CAN9_9HELO|nr:NADP-dependent oxidoreductase domain-containing protein [Calycina marina]